MLVQSVEDHIRIEVRLKNHSHAALWVGLCFVLDFQFLERMAHENWFSPCIT